MAKILDIGLKRNVEHMLSILKPIYGPLNKMQKNYFFIADVVEILKELSEHFKTEPHIEKIKLQVGVSKEKKIQHHLQFSPPKWPLDHIWIRGSMQAL